MYIVLSLFMFFATMLFSSVVFASDLPPIYRTTDMTKPAAPGFPPGNLEQFTRLTLKSSVPFDCKPGLYLRFGDKGALSAQLKLFGDNKVRDVKDGAKPDGTGRLSFFIGPELAERYNCKSANIATMSPVVDNALSQRLGEDLLQCGFTWKFR